MELVRTLGVLCEAPAPEHETIASALGIPAPDPEEWTRLFVLELPPYASIYLDAEGMIGGEARERVAGFWRALALAPPAEPDHLASLLGLYTALAEAERDEPDPARRALWREARTAFLWEHLASWLPLYLDALEALAGNGYAAWAGLLQDALAGEAARLSPPAGLPAQLRAAPALIVGGETGIDELELGSRLGERRTVLRTLLAQEPARTLGWLAAEAQRRAVRPAPFWFEREISRFWTERAEAAAALLSALGEEAARQEVSHVG
jgi:Nitrate reductase delta subunit